MADLVAAATGLQPDAVCPHPYRRKSSTIYVSDGEKTMGLCGMCLHTIKALVKSQAEVGVYVSTLTELGYSEEDARQLHADAEGVHPSSIELEEAA